MEIAIAVAEKVLEYTVAPIGRQFGYLIFYRNNVNELKEQLQKLEAERESLQHVVGEARRNGKEIERSVQEWLDRVDEIRGESEKFYQEESQTHTGCSYNSCPNLWSRHQLSRRAKKMVEELVKVKGEGKFDRVSYTKPPQWAATPSTSFYLGGEAFESRVSTLNSIMEALADNTITMVGVYGLGGVGKTTLAKEVAKKAQGEKLYDMVVMVEVKHNPENKTIQVEIADMVGLKFDEESEVIRASRLCERLKQEKKLLVILDDLWGRLDLRKIGIPSTDEQKRSKVLSADEYKGCKILLTSRSEEVLSNQMNCKRNIKVGELSEEEAWELFKEKAELHDESDPELLIVATQVAQKCAGLPIAIVTVARALRNKSPFEWRDALWQLQQPALRNVSGVKEVVDSSIKLSYDYLESKELKSIFLLSAMLSDDTYASVLLKYCVGLGLFQGIYTMERAQDRLDTLIQKLKASCLLLDSTDSDCFQMHDVVRDVALSIASNEQDHFVVRYDKIYEWPDLQNCKSMCLHYCDIKELPQKLYCPRLEALLLYCNDTNMRIPENFFEEMSPLRVMDLTDFHLSSLPTSIILLTNLTTLCLDLCVLGDIAMIGELKNLKVLSLMGSIIQQLPKELGQLTQLQLLDLSDCIKLEVIPQNVISSLNKLEALYLENSFIQWQDEGSNGKTANARVAELKDLTNLSTLYVHIPDASILPKDLFLDKLERYKLLIGDVWEWSCNYETSKTLKLKLKTSVHLEYGLKRLLERVEALYLDELIAIKDVVYELNKSGFPYLKHLWIQNNSQIECIINSTQVHVHDAFPKLETLVLANMIHLEKLCQGQLTMKSFSELRVIEVESCHQMKSLFSISHVRSFSQLVEIKISTCKLINQIVDLSNQEKMDNNTTIGKVQFQNLRSLTLNNLPALVSFCFDHTRSYASTMSYEKLDTFEPLFNDKIVFPNLDSLKLSSINFQKIWQDSLSACSWIKKLTNLTVEGCGSLPHIISTALAMSLVSLKRLEISRCEKVEEILFRPEDVKGKEAQNSIGALFSEEVIFPSLETVIFSHMENLQKIWPSHCAPDSFSKLKEVEINYCDKLMTAFPSYMLRSLCHVETVTITQCGSLETIYDLQGQNIRDAQGELETKLKNLIILHLPKLRDIWNSDPNSVLSFSNLQTVQVVGCGSLKNIFPTSVALNLVLLEELKIHNCGIEELVAKEENAKAITKFELPRLTSVTLVDLLKLKRFYPGVHILDCPKLKWLDVLYCQKMELFGFETKNFAATGDQLGQLDVAIEQPFFFVEKVVPNLEALSLSGMEARKIWKGQFREDLFQNISLLRLQEFKDKVAEFPYWFLHKMPNLKEMTVKYSSFRELFPIRRLVAEEKQTADIVRLRELYLWSLPRLESICKEGFQLDPVLEKLEELYVWECSSLANLIPISESFNCLTLLEVTQCDGLKNLFSPSTVKGLVHLKDMRIKECKKLQEIVARVDNEIEYEISFRHLESLELSRLPNLSSFCSGNNNFDFPYLEEVCVKQCSRMKIFSEGELRTTRLRIVHQEKKDESYWEGDLNSTIKKLYKDKVGFCGIEKMKFDEYPELIEIWNGKLPDWSFSNLKSLMMDKCDFLSYVIPSHLLCSLSNLEELQVSNCNSIEVVFDLQEIKQTHALVPLRLKKMTLVHLPKLMYVWNKDPQQIDLCQHLQELRAEECQSLRSIFPASIAKHLKRLNFLKIVCCGVEVIVSKEEVTEADAIFVFPQLDVLSLWKLPNLRNFYPRRHKLECPKLRALYVYQCQNVEAFGTVDAEEKDGVETRHPLFLLDKVNPNLEELVLNQKAVTSIRNGQFQADLFHKVNILYLESFHDEPLTFPYSFLERFPNLYKLSVNRSAFEEIFPCQEPFLDHMGKIPSIKELGLAYLDQLRNITKGDSQFELILQNLEKLDVECCSSLINVAPSSTSFHNLTTLNVWGCHGMIYLLTSSTAKSLVQLRKLKIDDCKLIAEIVTNKGEVEGNRIAMKKLEYMELTGLTSLKSFCYHNHAFEFASLIEVIVKGCPKMNMFCQGFLVTPILEGVLIEDDEVRWEDNLNKTIEQLFKEKDGQNSVEG